MSFTTIATRYGGLDARGRVIILTDNIMLKTARRIKAESAAFVKSVTVINLDEREDYSPAYSLEQNDLLIVHLGIDNFIKRGFPAFSKPP